MPILSGICSAAQKPFFAIYFRCETLADGMGGGTKAPPYKYLRSVVIGQGFTPTATCAIIPPTKARFSP